MLHAAPAVMQAAWAELPPARCSAGQEQAAALRCAPAAADTVLIVCTVFKNFGGAPHLLRSPATAHCGTPGSGTSARKSPGRAGDAAGERSGRGPAAASDLSMDIIPQYLPPHIHFQSSVRTPHRRAVRGAPCAAATEAGLPATASANRRRGRDGAVGSVRLPLPQNFLLHPQREGAKQHTSGAALT